MAAALLWNAHSAIASGPSSNRILNYQLRLTDLTGIPVADGTKNLKLTFYNAATAGTQLYTACSADGTPTGTPTAVVATFTNSTGTVLIGDTAGLTCATGTAVAIPATLFDNTLMYLGVTVGTDAEMSPRKRIVATGYALNADKLDDLDTSSAGGANAFVPVTDSSGNFTLTKNVTFDTTSFIVDATNHRVGIGDATPAALFTVGSGDKFQVDASGNLTTPSNVSWTLNAAVNALNVDGNTLSVDALNNRIGIGTAVPESPLEILKTLLTATEEPFIVLDSDNINNNAGSSIQFKDNNATGAGYYAAIAGIDDSDKDGRLEFRVSNNAIANTTALTASDTVMTIKQTGFVGIGTTGPGGMLHLSGTSNPNLIVEDTNGWGSGDAVRTLTVRDTGTDIMAVIPNASNWPPASSGGLKLALGMGNREAQFDFWNYRAFGGVNTYDMIWASANAGATDFVERMRISGHAATANVTFSNSNVGIGDTTPLALFTVGNGDKFQVDSSGNLTTPSSVTWTLNSAVNALNIGSNALSIDASNGRVGVGTTAPDGELHVVSTSTTNAFRGITTAQHSTSVQGAVLNFKKSRGTAASPAAVASGDFLGVFQNRAYDGIAYIQPASFGFVANGAVAAGSIPTDFYIATGAADDGLATNKRLYVTSAGNVGIGDTSPAALLTVGNGDLFQVDGSTGNVTTSGDAAVNGGDVTTTALTATLFNANATTVSVGGAATTLNLAGGSGSTGCTVDGSGNLACTGNVTGAASGTAGYWSRSVGGVLTTATSGDSVTLNGALNVPAGVAGTITLGDTTSDSVIFNANIASSLLPQSDNTYDLGSSSLRWKTLNVGPGSVVVHNDNTNVAKVVLQFSGATAQLTTDSTTPLQVLTGGAQALTVDTGGAASLSVGATNASGISIGHGTITTGVTGKLTVSHAPTTGSADETALTASASSNRAAGNTYGAQVFATESNASNNANVFGINVSASQAGTAANTVRGLGVSVAASGAANTVTAYGLKIDDAGSAATSAGTHYGIRSDVTTGTSGTHYGIYSNVSGGTNAYPGIFMGGNVGVGIATPQAELHVHGAIDGHGTIQLTSSLSGTTASDGSIIEHSGATNNLLIMNREAASIIFSTDNPATTELAITSTGNVGVGTASPVTADANALPILLDVQGGIGLKNNSSIAFRNSLNTASYPVLRVNGSDNLDFGDINNVFGGIRFFSGGQLQAVLTSAGNLGVNTSTPITQLHVPGRLPGSATGTVSTSETTPVPLFVQGRYAYVADQGGINDRLETVDISNPASPTLVGFVATNANPRGLYVQGKYAYLLAETASTMQVIDVSNPAAPSVVASAATGTQPYSVYVAGRYAYVVNAGSNSMQVFDVGKPSSPALVATYTGTLSSPRWIVVQDGYAYITNSGAANDFVEIVNVTNPASPAAAGTVATGSNSDPYGIFVQGRYAYVANNTAGTLQIFDVKNPAAASLAATFSVGSAPYAVFVQGRYAYVTNSGGSTLQAVDVSNPAAPANAGTVSTGASPYGLFVTGRYAVTANASGGTVQTFDLGGEYAQQFEAGGVETGSLNVRNNLQAMDGSFKGALSVGTHFTASGNLAVAGDGYIGGNLGVGTTAPSALFEVSPPSVTTAASARIHGGRNAGDTSTNQNALEITPRDTTTILSSFDYLGRLTVNPGGFGSFDTTTIDGSLLLGTRASGAKGLVIRGATSQTGNLTEWQNQAGTVMDVVDAGGNVGIGLSSVANARLQLHNTSGTYIHWTDDTTGSTSADGMFMGLNGTTEAFIETHDQTNFNIYHPSGNRRISINSSTGFTSIGPSAATSPNVSLDVRGSLSVGNDGVDATHSQIWFQTQHLGTLDTHHMILQAEADSTRQESLVISHNNVTPTDTSTNIRSFRFQWDGNAYGTAWNTTGIDVAETYATNDATLASGDLLTADPAGQEMVSRVTVPYQTAILGLVSTKPGLLLGGARHEITAFDPLTQQPLPDQPDPTGVVQRNVALVGRAPAKVNLENGPIAVGDPLTSSSAAGEAMRATKPGMIVGYALEAWNGPGSGTISVFVNSGWNSSGTIGTDGKLALFKDAFTFDKTGTATNDVHAWNSEALSFRGSAWDATAGAAVDKDMTLRTVVDPATSAARLSVANGSGAEVSYFGENGDVALSGRLYPSDRGVLQTNKYIYYDGSSGLGGDFMRTNAAGWGTGSYDFAEMFPSADALVAGELVMVDVANDTKFIRAVKDDAHPAFLLAGIVSTRPGFLAGMNDAGSYPIALSGRVPTRVVGPVKIGDPITFSPTPGVGTVATGPTYVVGIALQAKDGTGPGTVTVFVKPGWFDGSTVQAAANAVSGDTSSSAISSGSLTVNENTVDFSGRALLQVGAVEGMDGKWSIDAAGSLVAASLATGSLKAKDITVDATGADRIVGREMLETGHDAKLVNNAKAKANSLIMVTFDANPGSQWWIGERHDGSFVVNLASPAVQDVKFTYWIVGVDGAIPEPTPSTVTSSPTPPTDTTGTTAPTTGATDASGTPSTGTTGTTTPTDTTGTTTPTTGDSGTVSTP